MSTISCSKLPARPAASSAVSTSGSSRRPQATTVAPRRISSSAVSRPSPLPAPDTAQTWLSSSPSRNTCECELSAIGAQPIGASFRVMSGAMTVQVEAKPLHEPLAGGTPGATVVVEPLIAGHVDFPRAMMVSPGGHFLPLKLLRALLGPREPNVIPVPAFLIRHPSAGAILVDTGLHPSVATDGKENFGGLANRIGKPTLKSGEDVPAQLRKRGLDPGDLPVVVMTHMHSDHTSAISEFSKSTFLVSASVWEAAATGPPPTLNGSPHQHFACAVDYRTVAYDRAEIDPYARFRRSFDLLSD